jgi:hypothetical protein
MVAATMASNGMATIGINTVGFGYGSLGTMTVATGGGSVTFSAGGRGIDQNGDSKIGISEGFSAASPQSIISERDGRIQTDADLMQLVRVIEAGVDVDGNGVVDLSPSRISYVGVSMGGMIGASFLAVEPDVSAGALCVLGGPSIERYRLGSNRGGTGITASMTAANTLASRTPSLINAPGIKSLDGLSVTVPYFNENMPLRDGVPLTVTVDLGNGNTQTRVIQSPVTNDVPGAMAIQKVFDNYEWVSQSGDPVAYASYLRKHPLPGVPAKSVLVQFAKGDPLPVNPTTTAFLRAGHLADRATYYSYDVAFPGQDPNKRPSTAYPHTFAALVTSTTPTTTPGVTGVTVGKVALAAQQQFAAFLASDGKAKPIQPPGVPTDYFEVGMKESELPEGLNFTIPASAPAPGTAQASGSMASSPISTGAADDGLMVEPLTASVVTIAAPAGVPATPTAPLVDRALEALPPLARFEYALDIDDLAAGLLRPARRRR